MGNLSWTNKQGLPDTLVKAVMLDTHKMAAGGTISVTTLFEAPQIRYLKACFDYSMDVMEGMFAMLGTAMHTILERANIESERKRAFLHTADYLDTVAREMAASDPQKASTLSRGAKWLLSVIPALFPELTQKYIFEQSLTLDMGDHIISGTFDLYDKETGTLWDYKVCTTYQWTNPHNRKKWDKQLNTYAHMIRTQMGLPVNAIRVVAFFRDWSPSGVLHARDYPNTQIKEMFIPLYDTDQIITLLNHHLDEHRKCDTGVVPKCSGEERWAKSDIYAVMKQGARNAIKTFDSKMAAVDYIKLNQHRFPAGLWIQDRPGESRRCESYCVVRDVCQQFSEEKKKRQEIKF